MSDAMVSIVVAILSCVGTAAGAITGIIVSNRLSTYRIEQLEKKIDKYADTQSDINIRLVKVEESTKSAHKRLDGLFEQLNIHERRK